MVGCPSARMKVSNALILSSTEAMKLQQNQRLQKPFFFCVSLQHLRVSFLLQFKQFLSTHYFSECFKVRKCSPLLFCTNSGNNRNSSGSASCDFAKKEAGLAVMPFWPQHYLQLYAVCCLWGWYFEIIANTARLDSNFRFFVRFWHYSTR